MGAGGGGALGRGGAPPLGPAPPPGGGRGSRAGSRALCSAERSPARAAGPGGADPPATSAAPNRPRTCRVGPSAPGGARVGETEAPAQGSRVQSSPPGTRWPPPSFPFLCFTRAFFFFFFFSRLGLYPENRRPIQGSISCGPPPHAASRSSRAGTPGPCVLALVSTASASLPPRSSGTRAGAVAN